MGGQDPKAALAAEFPEWRIKDTYQQAATGPGAGQLTATKDGITLAAPDTAALARKIRDHDR